MMGTPSTPTAGAGAAAATPDPTISPALAKQLAAMQAEIEQLRAELKNRPGSEPVPAVTPAVTTPVTAKASAATTAAAIDPAAQASHTGLPEKPAPTDPFAYADWTWLNGTPRNKDAVWDSKFFTPEIRFDTHFIRTSTIRGTTPWAARPKSSALTNSR